LPTVEAKVVRAGQVAGTWDVLYEKTEEMESKVAVSRLAQWLVHDSVYCVGRVLRETDAGEFGIDIDIQEARPGEHTVAANTLRVIVDINTAKAQVAEAATTAISAAASAMVSTAFLRAAGWWPKEGNLVSVGFGKGIYHVGHVVEDKNNGHFLVRIKETEEHTVAAAALRVLDTEAAKAQAAEAAKAALSAAASAMALLAFLRAAGWWPKEGNLVSVGFGSMQQVWRDISRADAASIEIGMQVKVKVDRKGDGTSCEEATVVKADAGGGTWEVEYKEGGEKESGVVIHRLKRLVHEWAHSGYSNGTVQEDKEDGTFAVALDGLVMASALEDSEYRPKVGGRVVVLQEGEHKGKEGEITQDDKSSEPYIVKLDDGTMTDWLTTKEVAIRGEWGRSCIMSVCSSIVCVCGSCSSGGAEGDADSEGRGAASDSRYADGEGTSGGCGKGGCGRKDGRKVLPSRCNRYNRLCSRGGSSSSACSSGSAADGD
jgi:hypothetical protein